MEPNFTYADADRWLGGKTVLERVCPECSHLRKPQHRKLACFGLRRVGNDRITYCCQNCNLEGVVTAAWGGRRMERWRLHPKAWKTRPKPLEEPVDLGMVRWASELWLKSVPAKGTIVETYWQARKLTLPVPRTIRFLPKHQGHPTLIGGLGFNLRHVTGVQRIFLKADGSWHIGHGAKKSAGIVKGQPLIVHRGDGPGLVIGEGLEKVRRYCEWASLDGWACCGKSFLPSLAPVVSDDYESVTILRDYGVTTEVDLLANRLAVRGFDVWIHDQPEAGSWAMTA